MPLVYPHNCKALQLGEVCNILEKLCLNNNHSQTTEDEIHKWGGSANIFAMLNFLEKFFQSPEARRLSKRLEVFSVSIRDIMSNPTAFGGNFIRDFHNVALSLLTFAKFDPSQLVRFELIDPTNSSSTQSNHGLKQLHVFILTDMFEALEHLNH